METRKLNIFGELRARTDTNDRVREFVISTETLDRHGTVLRASGWDLSKFSGTAFYQHESDNIDPDYAIGHAEVWQEGRQVIGTIDFEEGDLNPLADKIMRKIDRGTLKNVSVGFFPRNIERGKRENGEDPSIHYIDAELVEFSVVKIPSNYQAQLRTAESELSEFAASLEPAKKVNTSKIKRAKLELLKRKTLKQFAK